MFNYHYYKIIEILLTLLQHQVRGMYENFKSGQCRLILHVVYVKPVDNKPTFR